MSLAEIRRVGPKGYIHNWIYVGMQAPGSSVFHPQLGHGVVIAHNGDQAKVKFDRTGAVHTFDAGASEGRPRLLPKNYSDLVISEKHRAAEARLKSIYGDHLSHDGSDTAKRYMREFGAVVPPEFHRVLAQRGTRLSFGHGPVTDYMPDLRNASMNVGDNRAGWRDVAGAYRESDRHLVIGNTASSGAHSLPGHESAHALDRALGPGRPVSDTGEFTDVMYMAVAGPHHDRINPYFRGRPTARSEMFAETFGTWMATRDRTPAERREAMSLSITSGRSVKIAGMGRLDQLYTRLFKEQGGSLK